MLSTFACLSQLGKVTAYKIPIFKHQLQPYGESRYGETAMKFQFTRQNFSPSKNFKKNQLGKKI